MIFLNVMRISSFVFVLWSVNEFQYTASDMISFSSVFEQMFHILTNYIRRETIQCLTLILNLKLDSLEYPPRLTRNAFSGEELKWIAKS